MARRFDDDEDDDRPRRPRKRRPVKKQGISPGAIAALVLIPLVLVAVAAGTWLALRAGGRNAAAKPEVGSNSEPGPAVPLPGAARPEPQPSDVPASGPAALVGLWERPDAGDGRPHRLVVRADNTASLFVHRKAGVVPPGVTAPAADIITARHGTWAVLEPVRPGHPFKVDFRYEKGLVTQRYTLRLDAPDRLTFVYAARPGKPDPDHVTLTRTGPPTEPTEPPEPPAGDAHAPEEPYEQPPPGPDGPLGRATVRWARAMVNDGLPFVVNVLPDGRFGVIFLRAGGATQGEAMTLVPLNPPQPGRWFRAELRGQLGRLPCHFKLDGTDRLWVAAGTATDPEASGVVFYRMNSRGKMAALRPNAVLPTATGYGPPGDPAGILAGVLERPAVPDRVPYRIEVRADGSAQLRFLVRNVEGGKNVDTVNVLRASLRVAQNGQPTVGFATDVGEYTYTFRPDPPRGYIVGIPGTTFPPVAFTRSGATGP